MHKSLTNILLALGLSLTTLCAHAANGQFSLTQPGKRTTIYSTGTGSVENYFFVLSSSFPSGTSSKRKTLTAVRYAITSYPSAITHTAEICYYKPYWADATRCVSVSGGSTGTTSNFNDLEFGPGVRIDIRHKFMGSSGPIAPTRPDNLTMYFTY